jgi:glycosyltransferase involved in cell wall biosynthesis
MKTKSDGKSLHILFVLEYFYPYHGGVERLFSHLIKELLNRGQHVTILTASYTGLPEKADYFGADMHRIKLNNRFEFSFHAIKMARRLAKTADIIHTTTYNAALPAWIASKLTGTPVVLTFHEYWGKAWWRLPFLSPFSRIAFWGYEQLIVRLPFNLVASVSDYTRNGLKPFHKPEISTTIYNGLLEIPKPSKIQRNYFYLFVGRLGVSKGIDILVPAINELLKDNSALRFVLIIPKEPKAILHFIKSELSQPIKEGQVKIEHQITDERLLHLMQTAKAVIVPSYTEGFGYVAAEAMQLNTPVIHSGRGALNEVISGKNLCMSDYSISGLKNAVIGFESGEYSIAPEKAFYISEATSKYLDAYERVLNQ